MWQLFEVGTVVSVVLLVRKQEHREVKRLSQILKLINCGGESQIQAGWLWSHYPQSPCSVASQQAGDEDSFVKTLYPVENLLSKRGVFLRKRNYCVEKIYIIK